MAGSRLIPFQDIYLLKAIGLDTCIVKTSFLSYSTIAGVDLEQRVHRNHTAIGSFNREFVRLYRAKESVAHKREGAAYACVR
jgi:hypothetical protein